MIDTDRERTAITTALAWQRASNEGDGARLLALSADDLAIGGPRGTVRGREHLLPWLARAGLHLRTLHFFARGECVVIEQAARWRDPATGALGDEHRVATLFTVADGLVVALARHDTVDAALVAGGLSAADLATTPESQL